MPAASILLLAALAAPPTGSADPLAGRWHGTSLCQVKASACRDEEAVYYISRKAGGGYRIDAKKIVAGTESDMGMLDVSYSPATRTVSGTSFDRAGRPGRWLFQLSGNRLSGRLVTQGNILFRLIEVRREPARAPQGGS